jgi:hypothetical protein
MTIPINLPNLGSTGVIQVPGIRQEIAQMFQNLPQVLMAVEEAKRQELNSEKNRQYQDWIMAQGDRNDAQKAQELAAQQQIQALIGGGLHRVLQAGQAQPMGPATGKLAENSAVQTMQQFMTRPGESVDQALGGVDPRALPDVMKIGGDTIKAKREQEAQSKKDQAFQAAIAKLDENTRKGLLAVAGMPDTISVEIRNKAFEQIVGNSGLSPKEKKTLTLEAVRMGMNLGQAEDWVGDQGGPGRGFMMPRTDSNANYAQRQDLRPATESESKAFISAVSMYRGARDMEGKGTKPLSRAEVATILSRFTGKKVEQALGQLKQISMSPGSQRWWSAAMSFMDPILRARTGAAFGESEVDMIMNQFIDLAGENELNSEKKRRRQEQVLLFLGQGHQGAQQQLKAKTFKQEQLDEIMKWAQATGATPAGSPVNPWRK